MLVPSKELLRHARAHKYAIPAFNINNLEILKAVMSAAEEFRSPIIIQTSEGAIAYAGMEYLVAMVKIAAKSELPVVLHVDHGRDLKIIKRAIDSGYTSVMFDGSHLSYQDNVEYTQTVATWAHAKGVSVEAELGRIVGMEDFVTVEDWEAALTNPKQAEEFVAATECDAFAVAIGTAHGAYKFKGKTHLDIDRLKKIEKLVAIPLVLHGASGVLEDVVKMAEHYGAKLGEARGTMDEDIVEAIKHGIAKINIDTDLRLAFTAGIREAVAELPKVIDPREILKPAMLLMTAVAKRKMCIFGSKGKG
ncbi:MAG: class II fructose-bisphosphate aldolase [Patescibacteria group bacterium]